MNRVRRCKIELELRTPNVERRVSTSVLFTLGMVVKALRRIAL